MSSVTVRILENCSLTANERLRVQVFSDAPIDSYPNIQVDIAEAGINNPRVVWSSGTSRKATEHVFETECTNFKPGIYEVKIVGFHGEPAEQAGGSVWCASGKDFARCLFEIRNDGAPLHTEEDLCAIVNDKEESLEKAFRSGIRLGDIPNSHYSAFVFVSGVLLSQRVRFDRYEIIPWEPLPVQNELDSVNSFFVNRLGLDVQFRYTPEVDLLLRQQNPCCVVHFPLIAASDEGQALRFLEQRVSSLLDLLAVQRGSSGRTYNIVFYDLETGAAKLQTPLTAYCGNLLVGDLAGENGQVLATQAAAVESPPMAFLVALYRQALAEKNPDFRYVRHWQILETMAAAKFRDQDGEVTDMDGRALLNSKGKKVRLSSSRGQVFSFLKETFREADGSWNPQAGAMMCRCKDGSNLTYSLWRFVESWAAMRDAAAHYGGFRTKDPLLQSEFGQVEICSRVLADCARAGSGFVLDRLESESLNALNRLMSVSA